MSMIGSGASPPAPSLHCSWPILLTLFSRGELTDLGKIEHQQLGHRLVKRLAPLFEKAIFNRHRNRISVVSSGRSRTIASLNAFVESLPLAIASRVDREPDNPDLLYFHEDSKYQNGFKKSKLLKNKIRSIQMQPYSREMARQVLERIFDTDFVDRLVNEEYSIIDRASGKSIKNEIDAAVMLHGLYLIAPNLRDEGVGDLLEKYFPLNASAWFAYLHDARVSDAICLISLRQFRSIFRNFMKKVLHSPIKR